MGDFPMMTARGTFIINGTERIVVSQLVRSPGVYFDINPDKTSPEKDIVSAKMIPGRGAWLEFEVDKKGVVYVRIDRKRKQPVTILLKALGLGETEEELLNLIVDPQGRPYDSMRNTLDKDSTENADAAFIDIYRKLRPGEPPTPDSAPQPDREPLLQPQALRHGQGRAPQGHQEAGRRVPEDRGDAEAPGHPGAERGPRRGPGRVHDEPRRHPRDGQLPREAARERPAERLLPRRHRPLRQPARALGGRADHEPGARRPLPHGAGRTRAHDHPGRRGDHAADPDQHPARGRGDQGVLRLQPAQSVHGPDQPARGPDAQAASVGPRPGRSEP